MNKVRTSMEFLIAWANLYPDFINLAAFRYPHDLVNRLQAKDKVTREEGEELERQILTLLGFTSYYFTRAENPRGFATWNQRTLQQDIETMNTFLQDRCFGNPWERYYMLDQTRRVYLEVEPSFTPFTTHVEYIRLKFDVNRDSVSPFGGVGLVVQETETGSILQRVILGIYGNFHLKNLPQDTQITFLLEI